MARDHGLVSVVDAAQSAPHLALNVRELGCDFLAFSGHKMLGPTGIGALYGTTGALERLAPSQLGGGVVERVTLRDYELRSPPARFEAGTPNIAGALGLAAATRYFENLQWSGIHQHARALTRALRDGLSRNRALRMIAAEGDALPILSLVAPNAAVHLQDVAMALSDRYGIMTRAGLLCVHPLFGSLGLPGGALRISAYVYNTLEEVEYLCESVAQLLSVMG